MKWLLQCSNYFLAVGQAHAVLHGPLYTNLKMGWNQNLLAPWLIKCQLTTWSWAQGFVCDDVSILVTGVNSIFIDLILRYSNFMWVLPGWCDNRELFGVLLYMVYNYEGNPPSTRCFVLFSFLSAWKTSWTNSWVADDLRRHDTDVTSL